MTPIHLTESRAIPVARDDAFTRTLATPLPELFSRRYLAMPPIREVREAPATYDSPGQSRRIMTSDGGQLVETLTHVDAPGSFGYRISDIKGPMKGMVESVAGEWSFAEAGTGTRITWSWAVSPRGTVGKLAMPAFGRMWHGYARQALAELERVLLG